MPILSHIFRRYVPVAHPLLKIQNPIDVLPVVSGEVNNHRVPFTKILDIKPHPNADRLEVATIYGFQVVIPKDKYKVDDAVVYVPIDSVLPLELEARLFPEGSKIKLHNHRVRQIKIRGLASQGMVVDFSDAEDFINVEKEHLVPDQDLATVLKIWKYEPPFKGVSTGGGAGQTRGRKGAHPDFHQYNGVNNIKWFPMLFDKGEEVVIQEKLHGTNARASLLPYMGVTWKQKILKFFRLAPKLYQAYGSNRVEISSKGNYNGYYNDDLYGNTFKALDVFNKLKIGESVFGEIIGPGIQKNYDYGLTEHKFILFDVKVIQADGKQKWLDPKEVEVFAKERGFEIVPVLYDGPFSKELAYKLTFGPSVYCSKQKIREGIVIKAKNNYSLEGNKQAYKWVSEDYLSDPTNTDEH